MATENTYKNLNKEEKLGAIMAELMPFFLFAALPIILTIIIAFTFGPSSNSNF